MHSIQKKYISVVLITICLLLYVQASISNKAKSASTQKEEQEKENINIESYMCRETNCEQIIINYIHQAKESIYCAFFEFNLENLHKTIKNKQPKVKKAILIDGDYEEFNDSFIFYENRSAFMHNKFCIIDNKITISGSMNPTINGNTKNDNNINIIHSRQIANVYTDYFKELMKEQQTKKKHNISKNYHITNLRNESISLCFSRGGNCLKKIRTEIKNAHTSIHFMLFTMTDKGITNELILKHLENKTVTGIFEKSLITKYSAFHKLKHHNIHVQKDCNPAKLHHKVFIIDEEIVITGSMNPSNNAEKNNDENLIVIQNKRIAEKYLNEFYRLQQLCMT